jgi:hypothetical protein
MLDTQNEKQVMLVVVFDHKGVMHHKHIPRGLLMNKRFCFTSNASFCPPDYSEQHYK